MKNRLRVSSSVEKQTRGKFVQIALPLILGVTLTVAFSVGATNGLLKGQLTTTAHPNKNTAPKAASIPPAYSAVNNSSASERLVDKYGAPAKSPRVAAAIRKAEVAVDAKQAADGLEALENGYMHHGTSQMQLIMHGYVPPGMPPQQAAILYGALPKIPKMPQMGPITPEMADQLAGVPADPAAGLTPGFSREGVEAQNQKIFDNYTRQRFGPVYVPPLHRGHNWLATHTQRTTSGSIVERDNQMSLIQPQYAYSGGNGPASIREMTDSSGNTQAEYNYDPYGRQTKIQGSLSSDFGYAGMYVHQPSGLNLAVHRVYSPALGRWLNRDPINDPTFRMTPRSPEPREPYASSTASNVAQLVTLNSASIRLPKIMNAYVYVNNNPISFTDPSGLSIGLPQPIPKKPDKKKKCPSDGDDPGLEWNECLVRCNGWGEGTPEWEDCMITCLGGY